MCNGHADRQAVAFCNADGKDDPDPEMRDPGVHCPEFWFKEFTACVRDVKTSEGPHKDHLPRHRFNIKEIRYLHEMYTRVIPEYGSLWTEATEKYFARFNAQELKKVGWDARVKKWETTLLWSKVFNKFRSELPDMLEREPYPEEADMVRFGIEWSANSFKSMTVGNVRFQANPDGGSWALSRPPIVRPRTRGEAAVVLHPDFGQVRSIYQHQGPDQKTRLITSMKWYQRVDPMYDASLRCPLVSTAEDVGVDVMWLASDLVPWHCMAMPLMTVQRNARETKLVKSKTMMVMLARSWSVLRHLGFPVQPHTYPFPDLPPVVSDAVQDEVDIIVPVDTDSDDSDWEPHSEEDNSDSSEYDGADDVDEDTLLEVHPT